MNGKSEKRSARVVILDIFFFTNHKNCEWGMKTRQLRSGCKFENRPIPNSNFSSFKLISEMLEVEETFGIKVVKNFQSYVYSIFFDF